MQQEAIPILLEPQKMGAVQAHRPGKDGLSAKGAVMFSRVQQNQHHSAAQRPVGRNYRRARKALSVLEPLSGVALSVFIAGILVPSFLRSGTAAHHGLAVGSLHTFTTGGVKLSYTLENLSFAILGAMFGSLIALAIEFPATFAKTTRNFLMFRQLDWNNQRKVVEWAVLIFVMLGVIVNIALLFRH